MTGFGETVSRFYVGQTKEEIEPNEYTKGGVYHSHAFVYEGFRVPNIGATEVHTDGEIFRRLCPNSFTEPPKTNSPELDLNLDCVSTIKKATQLATESGFLPIRRCGSDRGPGRRSGTATGGTAHARGLTTGIPGRVISAVWQTKELWFKTIIHQATDRRTPAGPPFGSLSLGALYAFLEKVFVIFGEEAHGVWVDCRTWRTPTD